MCWKTKHVTKQTKKEPLSRTALSKEVYVSRVDRVEMVEVIRTEALVGTGTIENPYKLIYIFHSKDGLLLGKVNKNDYLAR